jgi:hypothetical protein
MARRRKNSDELFNRNVQLRFTREQFERLKALVPPGVEQAAYFRELTLRGAGLSGEALLIKAVAFIVGALSPDISPDQAEALFLDHAQASSPADPAREEVQR